MRPADRAVREPGSYRDPDSRVFYDGEQVCRALSERGREDYDALSASGLLDDPRLIGTRLTDLPAPTGLLDGAPGAVLLHDRIPFLSYPYEWSFSMLKDAALLQLDLMLSALDHDLTLKDATPYNVQFDGTRPRFIDIGSFERLHEEELWVGYRQFCTLYLYPLLLQATKGLSPQPWLRGSLEGIAPKQMRGLLSIRDRFRRGYLTHVYLQARLDGHSTDRSPATVRRISRPGLGKAVITANIRKMRRLVGRLDWEPQAGVWTEYGVSNSYAEHEVGAKDAFVADVARSRSWPLVWDLGCNNGRHARLVAPAARQVVALDADHATVERLYRSLRGTPEGDSILPLTMNLADPSPGLGWRGLERKPLQDRGRPDLVLALALVHHLVIAANIPLREVLDWLAGLGAALVVEFPAREDPMVQRLLASKRAGLHRDYERDTFEALLHGAFDVRRSETLRSGTRTLYFATPKGRRPA
jgi:SAM-dependent methyltransferase